MPAEDNFQGRVHQEQYKKSPHIIAILTQGTLYPPANNNPFVLVVELLGHNRRVVAHIAAELIVTNGTRYCKRPLNTPCAKELQYCTASRLQYIQYKVRNIHFEW